MCAACEEEEHGCGVYALVLLSVLLRFGCGRDEAVVTGDSKGVTVDGEVWWIVVRLRVRWVRVVYVYVARNGVWGRETCRRSWC
jgi:hypothetical protein